jgi:hypothetical protein
MKWVGLLGVCNNSRSDPVSMVVFSERKEVVSAGVQTSYRVESGVELVADVSPVMNAEYTLPHPLCVRPSIHIHALPARDKRVNDISEYE